MLAAYMCCVRCTPPWPLPHNQPALRISRGRCCVSRHDAPGSPLLAARVVCCAMLCYAAPCRRSVRRCVSSCVRCRLRLTLLTSPSMWQRCAREAGQFQVALCRRGARWPLQPATSRSHGVAPKPSIWLWLHSLSVVWSQLCMTNLMVHGVAFDSRVVLSCSCGT